MCSVLYNTAHKKSPVLQKAYSWSMNQDMCRQKNIRKWVPLFIIIIIILVLFIILFVLNYYLRDSEVPC